MNKQQTRGNNFLSIPKIIILLFCFSVLQQCTKAYSAKQTLSDTEHFNKKEAVEIKYIGSTDDSYLLSLKLSNSDAEIFSLSITNEDGDCLYDSKLNTKQSTKKLIVSKDIDFMHLVFTINSGNTISTQAYNINLAVKNTQQMLVSRD